MSKYALSQIAAWRAHVKTVGIEQGFIKPQGRQKEGHDSYRPSVSLGMSRLGECQVYSGSRLPCPPIYLNVVCHIAMLRLAPEDKLPFQKFLYERVRTTKSLSAEGINQGYKAKAEELIDALSRPGLVSYN